jgi:hypothetical protein
MAIVRRTVTVIDEIEVNENGDVMMAIAAARSSGEWTRLQEVAIYEVDVDGTVSQMSGQISWAEVKQNGAG